MARRVLFALVALLCVASVFSAQFEASRLVQYERNGDKLGSHKHGLNLIATTNIDATTLDKQLLVVDAAQLTVEKLQELRCNKLIVLIFIAGRVMLLEAFLRHPGAFTACGIFIVTTKKVGGLLILVPQNESELSAEALESWKQVEAYLVSNLFNIPVWFASRTANVSELYEQLVADTTKGGASSDMWQFVATEAEPKILKTPAFANIHGLLSGASVKKDGGSDDIPTIAIVANYDSFAAAPGFAHGADATASGVSSVFQLARLFSRLYSTGHRSQGAYNLLFLLTAGGRLNFAGTRHFLENAENKLIENLDLAICVDAIGKGNGLTMHVSRPPKEPRTQLIYDTFSETAKQLGVDFNIVQKKINISDSSVQWEHEQFSRKKILAGTISHIAIGAPGFARSDIFDKAVDASVLQKNIQFLAESLAKLVFNMPASSTSLIFDGKFAPSTELQEAWMESLTSTPRMAPYFDVKAPLFAQMQSTLGSYVNDVTNQVFRYDGEYAMYNTTIKAAVEAHRVKPLSFDLIFSAIVLAFLAGLYSYLNGVSNTVNEVLDVVLRRKATKAKRA